MAKCIDLTGQRFGILTVIEREGNDNNGRALWKCSCDCGKTTTTRGKNLRSGNTKSCGCMRGTSGGVTEYISPEYRKHNGNTLYTVWLGMIRRCYNEHCENFHRYGGRGIKVCEEWKNNFETFVKWALSNGYNHDLQIDRMDNDGNYEPSNCRWVTVVENARNRNMLESNKSGCSGVIHIVAKEGKEKWRVIIGVDNKKVCCGTYYNYEDAVNARKEAENKYWNN